MKGITISYAKYRELLEDSKTLKQIRSKALKRQKRFHKKKK